MNKKVIVAALFVLVALTGRAQVKSGLDLCLRDEATGEWLIGLFDEYAIYDCAYWDYAEAGKDRVVLTRDGQRREVRLKKKAVTIDGVKHRTSPLTFRALPDYPVKDEAKWPSGIDAEADSVTLRVCVRTAKEGTEYNSFIEGLFNDKHVSELTQADSLGRFAVRLPVNGSAVMGIFNDHRHPLEHTLWTKLAVAGGDSLFLYFDDINDRAYVMGGRYARFNNELIGGDFQPDFLSTDQLSIDSTIAEQHRHLAVCRERMDSLYAARLNLSRRFRTYYQDYVQNQFAYPMLQKCCWPGAGESQKELLQKTEAELNPLKWMRSELPLMCRYDFGINIGYYLAAQTAVKQQKVTDPSDFILQLYGEGKVQLSDEEVQKVKNFQELRANWHEGIDLNGPFRSDIIPILDKPLIEQYWDWENSEKEVPLEIGVINSLDVDDATREVLKTRTFMQNIDGKSHVASPRVLELAHQEVHHPRLIRAIDDANQRIKDFLEESQRRQTVAPKEGTPASLRVADEDLKGITDGKALFERIIAPFRGSVIYVDVWGTWCGPCRGQMEHVPALKKALEGKPVVYLYFCNNSPEETWRTFITQKHLDTDNAVHYNLPREQENAIERYLEVSGFPTYRFVTPAGRLLPGSASAPSNLSSVVATVEMLLAR